MSEHEHECPLCGLRGTESTDIYTHLMTAHRKSTICTELLETHGIRTEFSGGSA